MAETIFLLIVVGFVLLLSIPWLMHLGRFYAFRLIFHLFRFEKATINLSPKATKDAHIAMEVIKDKERLKEWIS